MTTSTLPDTLKEIDRQLIGYRLTVKQSFDQRAYNAAMLQINNLEKRKAEILRERSK